MFLFYYRCRFEWICPPFEDIRKINHLDTLIIDGLCEDGCNSSSLAYKFDIYFSYNLLVSGVDWVSLDPQYLYLATGN